jgi:hypothetical protein
MIKIRNTSVHGFEPAIRGMRNPLNSWEKSDSRFFDYSSEDTQFGAVANHYHDIMNRTIIIPNDSDDFESDYTPDVVGENDYNLMMKLAKAGTTHSKYRRMLTVYCDITAPLYWWKEFDTYKVGTVANSCSTMHKIQEKEFTLDDFSHEHLIDDDFVLSDYILKWTITMLNRARDAFLKTGDKKYWWQMIQLLPTSYNQKRTVMMNYEVLAGIYPNRKDHKLDEWHEFCEWIKLLPYSELITMEEN